MAVYVLMPKLGLTMEVGTIIKWNFKDGDQVREGDILYHLETDKLTNDVESPASGILRIKHQAGDTVKITEVVGAVTEPGENFYFDGEALAEETPAIAVNPVSTAPIPVDEGLTRANGKILASPKAKKIATEKNIDLGALVGTGPDGLIVARDLSNAKVVKSSPLAAKMAVDLGVDLQTIARDGRIMSADVLATSVRAGQPEHAVDVRREPMNAMRQAIARNMSASWNVAPMVHYQLRADMTALDELRRNLQGPERKIGYTDLMIIIVAKALKAFPVLNSSIEDDEIIYHDYVNMGVAVALDHGLIVPVIKSADSKGLEVISLELKELAEKARRGRLTPDEFSGGTFTISNLGMFGLESFTPIINQPESAILGLSAIVKTAVEIDGEIVMRPMMNLCLTADHRNVDGAVGAGFMAMLRDLICTPGKLLL